MIAWWPGDGSAADIVGSHNGTLQNGAGFAAGKVSQAFNFNGSNQLVQVADDSAWTLGSSDFSIDLWANFNQSDGDQPLIGHDEGPGNANKWTGGEVEACLETSAFGSDHRSVALGGEAAHVDPGAHLPFLPRRDLLAQP